MVEGSSRGDDRGHSCERQTLSAIIGLIAKILADLLGGLLSSQGTVGRVSPWTNALTPTPKADLDARLRRAGLLLCVVAVLGGCGVFERKTEVVVSTLFPLDDWPGGFPILAQGTVRVMLPDGTIGELKDAGGLMLVHPRDMKARLKQP
jgi:hypothetical protein